MEIDLQGDLPQHIKFLIRAKAFEFKNDGVHKIDASDIKDYLYEIVWKDKDTIMLCDMVDDIMTVQFSTIFDYLKFKVIKEANQMNIADFNELIFK